jgi:hypothetical protein
MALTGRRAIGDGLRDDADVGDSRLAKRIDHAGESAKGNGFIAAQEDGVPRMLELLADFACKIVDVDGIVAEINFLGFVDRDDQTLLGDFFYGVGFGDVDFNSGLQDGSGDHEDDQKDKDHINERNHVDFREGGLRGFGELGHGWL